MLMFTLLYNVDKVLEKYSYSTVIPERREKVNSIYIDTKKLNH